MKPVSKAVEKQYFIKYIGQQRVISLSGLGKIVIGKEYLVSKEIAQSVRHMDDWVVVEK